MNQSHDFAAHKISTIAKWLLKILSGLLTGAILIQFFIAGMSSLTAPDW